jgi:endonuclease/exonuclease/phosphatase family metal-dependent hydrolase
MQEIKSDSAFVAMVALLQAQDAENHWAGFRANSDAWDQNLAYIYKSSEVIISSISEIYRNDELYHGPFPRSPLVMEANWKGFELVLINNHYKARGGEENEARRAQASRLIDQYITANYDRANVIMLGDLNDKITDDKATNVFLPFLDKPEEYRFADMIIAQDSTASWSYPYWKYRGHIDHILISNELFDEFEQEASGVKTVVIDAVMEGGDDARYKYITDHRPVVLKLAVPTN